jgi:NTP pyrophosphatase (non-canonical NTP hydrolase)
MDKHQKELDRVFKELGWDYWSPHELIASLAEETGELARLVNYLHGPKKKKDTEQHQELEGEIGDILLNVICFANVYGINLDTAIENTLKKVAIRDKDRFN